MIIVNFVVFSVLKDRLNFQKAYFKIKQKITPVALQNVVARQDLNE